MTDDAWIVSGDCREYMVGMRDESVDCIVTDPPYGVSFQSARRTESERFDPIDGDAEVDASWVPSAFRVLKDGGAFYCFTRWDVMHEWIQAIESAGGDVRNCIVWDRGVHGMGDLAGSWAPRHDFVLFASKGRHVLRGPRRPDIIKVNRPAVHEMRHPTEKPVELLWPLIEASTDEGDLVFDPFVGSGSTAVAAVQKGRTALGVEISDDYSEIARGRLANLPKAWRFQ